MRNISLTATAITSLPNANVTAIAIDVDDNALYATSESPNPDADVEVNVWKVPLTEESSTKDQISSPSNFMTFSTIASTSHSLAPQVLCFHLLPESRRLAVVMRGGDIRMIGIDEEDPVAEVEGTVEPGIFAAAWSPDDSLLVLVTGDDKLLLMTSTFDVLSEAPLYPTDFGEDAPINVGWGSKQTQFHGSQGKVAAQASPATVIGSSPDDDGAARISWRGDCGFFVVSALSPAGTGTPRHRTLRVYDRQAVLQSTAEPVAGLEHPVTWRPSGNLIAGTQRFGFEGGGAGKEGRHDVVFFERNGLRHGEFGLRVGDLGMKPAARSESKGGENQRWGYKVRELSWSSDSNVLAVWIERDIGDVVQLWTTGNYHWYLKHEILAPSSSRSQPSHFTSVSWHPETPLHLILTTTSEIIQRTYSWATFTSPTQPPEDSGCVAVFDGSMVLLTPFRIQNVPPPMSSYQISLSSDLSQKPCMPVHASFAPAHDILGVLWESGWVELWDLHTCFDLKSGKAMTPSRIWAGHCHENLSRESKQIALWHTNARSSVPGIVILCSDRQGSDLLTVLEFDPDMVAQTFTIGMPRRNGRLVTCRGPIVWQAPDGELFNIDHHNRLFAPVAHFSEFCFSSEHVSLATGNTDGDSSVSLSSLFVGLATSGKLYATNNSAPAQVLSSNATSFTVISGFVIFTTSTHEAVFVPTIAMPSLTDGARGGTQSMPTDWEKRKIERGSRIVVAVASSMSLVLQMPRGNLETVSPRPLIMEVVRQDLDIGNYRKAFFACRKHRIDLNFLVEHHSATFMKRLASFVDQVDEVDHINLFLTSIGRGSQPPETISSFCDAIRVELEKRNLTKYVNSILTAYVVKTPPDHEAGLALLLRLRDDNPHLVEDAVKYIIFLVDADSLFDTALGMYDFSLVLMIAQHSQKDPREYLPFLHELRALDKYYQRFKIDDHLKRHEKALQNLSLAGDSHFDEAIAYIERHQLYEPALSIWKSTDRYKSVLDIYGDWLFERREFRQAASIFIEAGLLAKAMVAYEKALEWQGLFELAMRTELPEDDILDMGYRVAEDLSSKKRYSEAAQVLLDYSNDIREAVISLVQGNHFSEARRIITLKSVPELVTDIIHPGALESRLQLAEEIGEMRVQLRKQLSRLCELRVKKVEEPDAFFGVEDPNLYNVDVMTDASMQPSVFTRYTVAPSSVLSRTSKRSSRSKRKLERKVGSGRKGTVDEEEYLLKSVSKLVGRFDVARSEARNLLPHLLQFTAEHRAAARSLQDEVKHFELELKGALEEIWAKPSTENEEERDSWMKRMEVKEKERMINPLDKVPKPELSAEVDWQIKLFDLDLG